MILPCYYLPPISWFAALKSGEPTCSVPPSPLGEELEVRLEVCENFHKQTLRNRCYIDSPNGKLSLSFPIDKSNFSNGEKCLTRDVMISHQLDWRHQHWQAFETSYFNSPFFEYLQDDFRPVYEREWKYLADLNECLIEKCLNILELDTKINRTTEFQGVNPTPCFEQKPYYQVYSHKHGFLSDLSIIDLIFNMGPEASLYL